MTKRYKISEAPWKLNDAGIRFYDYGMIKQGKAALFEYFQTDSVTDSQIDMLKAYCPDIQIKYTRAQYAPEIKSVLICFPKAAWYRANT